MGKIKKEKIEAAEETIIKEENGLSYDEKLNNTTVVAKPMASKKLTKKCYKLMKKASQHKKYLLSGIRQVQKRIQKGDTGIVLFAGNVTPIDIMIHLPGVCEEKSIPYCYTPCREDMGSAIGMKRSLITVLIKEHEDYKDLYDECKEEITTLATPL